MMQLDLFTWSPPLEIIMEDSAPATSGAMVICFPQRRNVGKVRHVAQHIVRRAEGRERESYWRQVCNRMAANMSKHGFDDAEINRQLNSFAEVVSVEMHRICGGDREQPGGAA